MKAPSTKVRAIQNLVVGMAYLIAGVVADSFDALRADVIRLAGFDFLRVLGDMMRPASFVQNNPGSVTRSLHKCGVAFDYNQGEKNLVLVAEPKQGRMYWRTYLRIVKPELRVTSQFVALRTVQSTGGPVTAWLLDFTALMERHGWRRIAAQNNWQKHWQKREFWHCQHTWADQFGTDPYDRLMAYLYPKH